MNTKAPSRSRVPTLSTAQVMIGAVVFALGNLAVPVLLRGSCRLRDGARRRRVALAADRPCL
jgi:hypothetical protein